MSCESIGLGAGLAAGCVAVVAWIVRRATVREPRTPEVLLPPAVRDPEIRAERLRTHADEARALADKPELTTADRDAWLDRTRDVDR